MKVTMKNRERVLSHFKSFADFGCCNVAGGVGAGFYLDCVVLWKKLINTARLLRENTGYSLPQACREAIAIEEIDNLVTYTDDDFRAIDYLVKGMKRKTLSPTR